MQLEQERLGYEEALRLQVEIDEEERQRIGKVQEEASSFNIEEWDDIQAIVEADEEFTQRLQSKEREMYSKAKKSRLLAKLINERKRYFAAQRAEERRNKPLTQAQQRTYMSQYIKNIGSHTLKKLKSYSFDEIKNLFEITIRRVHTFVPMESESERVILELAARSSKREAEEELVQESSKRLKTGERSVPAEESKDKEEEEELSQERILQMMIIVLEHGMNVEALQTKYPIIDWEIYTKGARKEDFVKLWSLVKEKFTSAELTECWKHKKYRSLPSCNSFKNLFKTQQTHNQTQFLSTTDRSICNLFDTTLSMTTLADKSLLSGGDNKPPMLEKHLYDSWKSRMELYMMNRPHGRMILASVEKGPFVWPSITVEGVTRLKEYTKLTPAEAIQADCDIKAINIILQGTSLTKQERECKLYDEFDKFTYKKGESLHEYYLRFTLLLNDMNIYKMPLEQFQVNTKFLNTLPDEWRKFVTDVKLVKDLHTTNVDQLHAYLQQHKRHANEVCLMHERNSDPLALVASHQLPPSTYQSHLHTLPNSQLQHHVSPYPSSQFVTPYQTQQFTTSQSTPLSITYPSNEYQSSVHHNVYSPQSSIPQLEYAPTTYQHQQSEFSQPDSGLIVPVFQKGDDPIDAINHMMSFLTAVVTSRYPTTNNQLRTSSNPRQQATIYDGKVTVQPVQGRQTTYAAGTTRKYTPNLVQVRSNTGKQRLSSKWQALTEEEIAFLAESRTALIFKPLRQFITHNAALSRPMNQDAYDSDCDNLNSANRFGSYVANLSRNGSDALTEVLNPDNLTYDLFNQSEQIMTSSEQSNDVSQSETEITSDSNIIPYSQYLSEAQQETVQNSNSSAQQMS
ncbi:hypothetical protein Tco_1189472 [Tanacetum coccineum]